MSTRNFGGAMLSSSIGCVRVACGIINDDAGLAALFSPHLFLRLVFGVESPNSAFVVFVRHWGVLIFVVGALIVYSAYVPTVRVPVLVAAAIEKFAIGFLAFLGPMKR